MAANNKGGRSYIETLESRRLLSVASPIDLNLATPPSDPSPVKVAGGVGYFTATTPDTGRELWRTDGTEAGTVQVAELVAGSGTLNPTLLQPVGNRMLLLAGPYTFQMNELWATDGTAGGTARLAVLPGTVYATATTGGVAFAVVERSSSGAAELWRSDGTAAGTFKLMDLSGGTGTTLTATSSYVFFANTSPNEGVELWRSDGTVAGTVRAADVRLGLASSSPNQITAVGNRVFFMATDGTAGTELWRSDGTAQNTVRVADLEPGITNAVASNLTGGTSQLYFVFHNNVWRSDGTAAGTVAVTTNPTSPTLNYRVVTAGDRAYIGLLTSGTSVPQLWTTTGTAASTSLVWTGSGTGWFNPPTSMVGVGGRLYFRAVRSGTDDTLYVTDGTPGGTHAVTAAYPLLPADNVGANFADLGGAAVFPAKRADTHDVELYRTDGTSAGTRRVSDINATATASSSPLNATGIAGTAYFWATGQDGPDGVLAYGLYASDGTAAGTRRLLEGGGSGPIVGWRGRAYFMSGGQGLGAELWSSDGTVAGTRPVADISPGAAGTTIEMLYPTDDYLYFAATTTAYGRELWRTDGTATGTVMVRDVNPGPGNGIQYDPLNPWSFAESGGLLYFYGWDTPKTPHLFRTDGTDAGTVQLADLAPDVYFRDKQNFAQAGGRQFVRSPMYNSESELWTTDGTPGGTHKLKDINPGTNSSDPDFLTEFRGRLYFAATSPDTGRELWVSDGTSDGTTLFKDIAPGTAGSYPIQLTVVGDELFFAATDGVHGVEWWKSDGTAAGTVMIRDIEPGPGGSVTVGHDFAHQVIGGVLVFIVDRPNGDAQFWRSDGTTDGTYALTAFPPSLRFDSGYDGWFVGRAQGYLYYSFDTATYGRELWRSDGTPAGTGMLPETVPGPGSSYPGFLVAAGTSALFAAESATIGREPWVINDDVPPIVTAARFAPGAPRPGVTIRFNEAVSGPLSAAGLTVTNLDTGELVSTGSLSVVLDAATELLTVAPAAGVQLADGNYRLTLAAGAVTDTAGNAFAGGYTFDFFVLAGDANRDRTVNFDDLLVLAKNYNKTGATFAQGDFTGDGTVNFDDLLVLAKNYNRTLPASGAAPAPTAAMDVQALAATMGIAVPTTTTTTTTKPAPAKKPPVSPKPAPKPTPVVRAVAPAPAPVVASVLRDDDKAKRVFSTTRVAKPAHKPAPARPKAVARSKGRCTASDVRSIQER